MNFVALGKTYLLGLALVFGFAAGSFARPKNIILMIGDGMGPQQIGMADLYKRYATSSDKKPLAMRTIMNAGSNGIVMTEPYGHLVVDSACSASQYATGQYALSETLGLDHRGDPVETILELAKKKGKSTGLVSDVRLTHATPAAFIAHVAHRSMENEIAEQILASQADVLLSGGIRHFLPQTVNDKNSPAYQDALKMIGYKEMIRSKRKDQKNLLEQAIKGDYQLVFDRQGLSSVKKGRLLGLFAYSEMQDGITHTQTKSSSSRTEPTLKEMTVKALDVLSQNPKGFFLMVEGGQIDWAGHENDAGLLLHEMLKFDETVAYVFDWVKKRKDTLVVFTADHETGSFGFSHSLAGVPAPVKVSGKAFGEMLHQPGYNFAPLSLLDRIYAQKIGQKAFFNKFMARPDGEKTAKNLLAAINSHFSFRLEERQMSAFLNLVPNPFYDETDPYLDDKETVEIKDFHVFYGLMQNNYSTRLARELASQQNVVWGTGTHTSTPVVLGAYGDGHRRFAGMMHSTEVGQRLIALIR